jgi:hypothetical protein
MGSIFSPKMPSLPPVQPLPPAPSTELSPEAKKKLQQNRQRLKEKEKVDNQLF